YRPSIGGSVPCESGAPGPGQQPRPPPTCTDNVDAVRRLDRRGAQPVTEIITFNRTVHQRSLVSTTTSRRAHDIDGRHCHGCSAMSAAVSSPPLTSERRGLVHRTRGPDHGRRPRHRPCLPYRPSEPWRRDQFTRTARGPRFRRAQHSNRTSDTPPTRSTP